MKWITEGFDGFSNGSFENGGQNLYVSKKGTLQRIFQYDVNQDGYPDLLFACSQSMYERPPIHVYRDILHDNKPLILPSGGTYDGIMADLHGTGCDDLVLACQNNGTHSDLTAIIYFGNPDGYTERYRMELPAPNAMGVCVGDFNGDGKKEIVFLSNGHLRMFYQRENGFCPADFVDYDISAASIAAADFDGDGFCDLCIKDTDGRVGIIYGSENGLEAERIQWLLSESTDERLIEAGGSTAGLVVSATQWRPCVLVLDGKQYLFCMQKETALLYSCNKERNFSVDISFNCPGAVGVAAADLTGNGQDDLAVAVFAGREDTAKCRLYLNAANRDTWDQYTAVPVKGAVSVTIASLDGNKAIFCRTGEKVEQEVPSPIVELKSDGSAEVIATVTGGDCAHILAGRPDGNADHDQVVVLNHIMNRKQGGENIYIYLGGKDGYQEKRRLELPGHSSVDGAMCDFFDTGSVDVLVSNCFEDAPHLDNGSYIYRNSGCGFDEKNKVILPTVRAHGAAIGDFRKSGYLDIAFGGYENRELRIFHGSEKGYSLENCTRIVLGPDEPEYQPKKYAEGDRWNDGMTQEQQKNLTEFGQVRWLLAADFNGDGWLDLFVSEIDGPRCFIFWGGPDGFSKGRMTALQTDGVASAAVADLNGNGYPDLILAQNMSTKKTVKQESYITVYWGGADGYQENRKMQLPASCANAVTVGDYRGCGQLDIYATSYNNGRCRDLLSYLYENDHGNFSTMRVKYLFNHSGSGCVSGDFNGDGYTDLAVACHKEYGNHEAHSFIFWGGPDGLSDERKTKLPATGPHGMCTVDPGNILNRGPKEHYTSAVKILPTNARLEKITWQGVCTSSSWVEVEVRSANTEADIQNAPWQRVESGADITGLQLKGAIQYRLALCAKCSCGTPRITKVEVEIQEDC